MNDSKPTYSDKKRLLVVGGLLFFLFTLLIGQFFRIQIIEGKKWQHFAGQQHYFDITEPFVRGTFYSNTSLKKGHPEGIQKYAFDIRKFHLFIDPKAIPACYKNEIASKLITFTQPPKKDVPHFFAQFNKESHSRKIFSWMDEPTKERILKWWLPYAKERKIATNAIFVVGDTLRSHPFGKLLGQVLHTVRVEKDDVTTQSFPTGGLELSLNKFLTGSSGKRRLLRSPRHALETSQMIDKPTHGADIYLTINHYLQAICEEEIERGVKTCKALSGWALMMDPYTGEILALAQYPFFSPDNYQHYFNNPTLIEHTKVKAITDANEPGSIMKAITAAIALKANKALLAQGRPPLFNPNDRIETANGHFPGRSKPIKDSRVHRYLNMQLALQKSSNIYVARLAQRIVNTLGNDWYRRELEQTFGFGKRTGLELPSESPGVLPTPGKKHPNGTFEWSQPTPFSIAMGHNIQATSLQMARAFAIFANGGYAVEPTLIRKIVKGDEVLLDNTTAERIKKFPQVLDHDIVQSIVQSLKLITKKGASAPAANIFGYTEAGKTGTAEKIINGTYSKTKNVTSFVGFAPANMPAFVLLVCMDEPAVFFVPGLGHNQRGGAACAPVFREIGRRTLEYLGIAPDDPYGYAPGDPRYDANKADCAMELQRLEALYKQWNSG